MNKERGSITRDEALILIVMGFVVFCLLLPQMGRADDLTISGFAWHAQAHDLGPKDKHFNEVNPGIGYEHTLSDNSTLAIGYYENSFFRNSDYLLYMYQPVHYGNWKFGASIGGITGYYNHIMPVILPTASWQYKWFGVNLIVIPVAPLDKQSILALQFKIGLP